MIALAARICMTLLAVDQRFSRQVKIVGLSPSSTDNATFPALPLSFLHHPRMPRFDVFFNLSTVPV
jgi:hypothetical protein